MKLKLHMDDYLTAIGGVALLRLQEWACNHLPQWRGMLDTQKPIQSKSDFVEVDSSVLEHLPEWYFKFLMDKHSVTAREREKFKTITDFKYTSPKEQILRLKEAINDNFKKLNRYFSDHPQLHRMHDLLESVKTLNPDRAETELEQLRDHYVELLATAEFEEKLTLNIIRSFLFNNFFGQTSMLQRSRSNYTLQQHIDCMIQDFVKPVLVDIELLEWLNKTIAWDKQSQLQLVELLKNSGKTLYKQWSNQLKKLEPDNIETFLKEQLRCSFEEEWFATVQFEEMIFAPLGISGSRPNFNWNFNYPQMPISSWIKLVLFLAPIGLTRFTRLYKNGLYKDEYETYYSFIYRDGTPQSIFADNNELENLEHNESFDRLIPKLVQRDAFKARREAQPNIQVIEFYSDIEIRKTVMNYYHIPRHILMYFEGSLNKLSQLNRAIRDPFLQLVMENIDPINVIWLYLQKVIRGKGHAFSAYMALRERCIIQELKKKEGIRMPEHEIKKKAGFIYHVAQEGVKIRKGLERRADKQSESADYVSSGGKRAAGIAHRLLNAAKANDKQQFLDTTIRLYLSVGEPVPTSLLNVLHEEKIDFASWSGAFISGLLGSNPSEKSENENENENEAVQ